MIACLFVTTRRRISRCGDPSVRASRVFGRISKNESPIHRVVARSHQRDTEDVNAKVTPSHSLGAEYFCLDDGFPFVG